VTAASYRPVTSARLKAGFPLTTKGESMKTFWIAMEGDGPIFFQYDPRPVFIEMYRDARRVELAHDPLKAWSYEGEIALSAHRLIVQNREAIVRKFRQFLKEWLATRSLDPIPHRDPYASIEWET
jgi:hypothetical protein